MKKEVGQLIAQRDNYLNLASQEVDQTVKDRYLKAARQLEEAIDLSSGEDAVFTPTPETIVENTPYQPKEYEKTVIHGRPGRDGKDAVVDYDKIISTVTKKIKERPEKVVKIEKSLSEEEIEEIKESIKKDISYNDLKDIPLYRPAARDYDFLELKDVPKSYTGKAGKVLKVKTDERGVEFADDASGTGDVIGPASATNKGVALFDTTTGKLLKNSTSFVQLDNGNVGIGTTNPTEKVHIDGGAAVTRLEVKGSYGILKLTGSNSWGISSNNVGNLTFYNYGTSQNLMTILNDGKVGIGTSDPSAKLHTVDTSSGNVTTQLKLQNISAATGTGSAIEFVTNNTTTGKIVNKYLGSNNTEISFSNSNAGTLETGMTLNADKSLTVGGNITAPTIKLTTGAGAGKVLTSDADGDATWETLPSGGDMLLGTVQSVTAEKIFDKDKLSMKGTSTGKTVVSTANTSATDYTITMPAKTGTLATTDDISAKQNQIVSATSNTAAATAAKTATISGYTLTTGDLFAITFTNGNTAASMTLNINGGGALAIKSAGLAPTALTGTVTAGGTIFLYYNGTNFQMTGATQNTNTTYSEISEAEINAGTASTARAISGRRAKYIINKSLPIGGGVLTGGLETPAIKITTGAGLGKVLTSDADGDATWEDALGFTAENVANKKTDLTDNSDTYYPSQKAVKTAVDAKAPTASPTFTGTVTLPKTIEVQDTSADHQYVLAVNELTADRTVTLPLLTGNDEFTFNAHTQTLTNKRINPRLVTTTSYTTDTGTSLNIANCDQFEITAQAGALKFNNPGGTPTGGQKLIIRIKDNGTARALTYDTQFRAIGVTLPTTTVKSKTLYMGFIYNATDTKWDCVAVGQEA